MYVYSTFLHTRKRGKVGECMFLIRAMSRGSVDGWYRLLSESPVQSVQSQIKCFAESSGKPTANFGNVCIVVEQKRSNRVPVNECAARLEDDGSSGLKMVNLGAKQIGS
jgi:hypothetical protein